MNEFTASNGVTIRYKVGIDGAGYLIGTSPGLSGDEWTDASASPEGIEALREFFRAEEDERLGRWRSTIDAAWTVVVQADSGYVIFRHDDGERGFSVAPDQSNMPSWARELQEVAREYFDAHPEPWHDAKAGEVWVVNFDGLKEVVCYCVASSDYTGGIGFSPIGAPIAGPGIKDTIITSARRIFPEVAS